MHYDDVHDSLVVSCRNLPLYINLSISALSGFDTALSSHSGEGGREGGREEGKKGEGGKGEGGKMKGEVGHKGRKEGQREGEGRCMVV